MTVQAQTILEKLRNNPICIKIYSYLKWHERFTLIKNFGLRYKCPFCGYHAKKFLLMGQTHKVIFEKEIIGCGSRFARCPKCMSNDKERLVFAYLQNNIDFFSNPNKAVLHMAPEEHLSRLFFKHKFNDYICGDFFAPGYENAYPSYVKNINVLDIPYSSNHFDLVICNHVLEHVDNDTKAMAEIYRVLKTDGFAILQVPISFKLEKTYEDASITSFADREKAFGQGDHVRIYGLDYVDRLKKTGFDVEVRSDLAANNPKYGLNRKEKIFICHKRK